MRPKHLVAILVLLMLAIPASPAHAGGVVSVCDEAHLLAALAGGGTVTFTCSGTITLTTQITIATDTTIDGRGQTITVSGNKAVRVFDVDHGVTLNLNTLTIVNGVTDLYGAGGGILNSGTTIVTNGIISDNSAFWGGGIYNTPTGTLTVSNSTFSGNVADFGGGIRNDSGTITVSNSIFFRNGAISSGGGIDTGYPLLFWRERLSDCLPLVSSSGDHRSRNGRIDSNTSLPMMTVSNSMFVGNSAKWGGGISFGDGWLSVSNSTFVDNSAEYSSGGGIYSEQGGLTVSNSTFSGNSAKWGGGISFFLGLLTVSNSTFSGNSATTGGGIHNHTATVTLRNTIVANNRPGGNCSGPITDGGGNLSYPGTACPGINLNPLLGPLQDNGGPTPTMSLGPGSAAIDAGDDAICAADPVNNLDQRGVSRPLGRHCDIGAVEQQPYKSLWFPSARVH